MHTYTCFSRVMPGPRPKPVQMFLKWTFQIFLQEQVLRQ